MKTRLHEIIFEAETPAGKAFDIGLILTILLSVLVIMLESVAGIRQQCGPVRRQWNGASPLLLPLSTSCGFIASVTAALCRQFLRPGRFAGDYSYVFKRLFTGDPIFVCYPHPPNFAGFSGFKAAAILGVRRATLSHASGRAGGKFHFPLCRHNFGDHHRIVHVSHRRREKWFYQHTPQYLLGHRDAHHRWVWGYCPGQTDLGQALAALVMIIGYGIYCRAYRHCYSGTGQRLSHILQHPGLPGMRLRRP